MNVVARTFTELIGPVTWISRSFSYQTQKHSVCCFVFSPVRPLATIGQVQQISDNGNGPWAGGKRKRLGRASAQSRSYSMNRIDEECEEHSVNSVEMGEGLEEPCRLHV